MICRTDAEFVFTVDSHEGIIGDDSVPGMAKQYFREIKAELSERNAPKEGWQL